MLFRLSLRNARRQAGDYLVYFITITLTAAFMFAFNGLVDSREIQELSEMLEELPMVIGLASIAVVAIMGWLVNYIMRFMLSKRSRELGTYLLMGLENKQIIRLFFAENLAVGGLALLLGLVLGNLIFQCLRAIIMNLFQIPYYFSFHFSMKPVILTCIYFIIIFAFALLRSRRSIRKNKIRELLYFDRQNETEAVKKKASRKRLFTVSVTTGVIGMGMMILIKSFGVQLIGAAVVMVSLYGFFINFSSGVPAFFEKRPSLKYKNTNLLVFRSLASKLTTMGITMATIAVLFAATLISSGMALLFVNQFQRHEELITNFDLYISSEEPEKSFGDYRSYIHENIAVREEHEYDMYFTGNDKIIQYIEGSGQKFWHDYESDMVMKLSDYQKLRKMLGYAEVSLTADRYIIHCLEHLEYLMEPYQDPIEIGGRTLQKADVYTEGFTQYRWGGNGDGFILVVPDEALTGQERGVRSYAVMAEDSVSKKELDGLLEIMNKKALDKTFSDSIHSAGATREENASMYAMVIFPLFYLALVLTMAAATILSVQLLSDTARYRRQFELLRKLGQSRKDMLRALRKQFGLFFAMPVLPPLFISVTFLMGLAGLFDPGIIRGVWHLMGILGGTIGTFLLIYLVYIVATYKSFKRIGRE